MATIPSRAWGYGLGADQQAHQRRGAREGWRLHLVGALVSALIITFLSCRLSAWLSIPEFGLLDVWMRLRTPRQPDSRIVLVGIERALVDRYEKRRPPDCACDTIPRSEIGQAVELLGRAGAGVLMLHLTFDGLCPREPITGRDHDAPLRRAIKQFPGQTVVAAKSKPNPEGTDFVDPKPELLGDPLPIVASPELYRPHNAIRGVCLIQSEAHSELDRSEVWPLGFVAKLYPSCSAAAYTALVGKDPRELPTPVSDEVVRCGDLLVPVWPCERVYLFHPLTAPDAPSKYAMLINWVGSPGTFPTVGFSNLQRLTLDQLQHLFQGKVVLLGSLAERKATPMRRANHTVGFPFVDQSDQVTMSGLEIHANALDTLLQRRFIRPVACPLMWLVILVLCTAVAFSYRMLPAWLATGVMAFLVSLLAVTARVLIEWDYWLFSVVPGAGAIFTGVTTAIWVAAQTRRDAASLARQVDARDAVTETLVHDLKQPLAAIAALAAAIRAQQQSGLWGVSPEILQRIQQQVELGLGSIDELLTTSPERSLALSPRRFDLAALVRDLALAQSVRSPIHEIEVHAPPEGVEIVGDPRYLGRVITNLMDNAIKYWPSGGVVRVAIHASDRGVTLSVTDGGIGIPSHAKKAIFERFERAVPDEAHIPGTGMGLYSAKRILEAHGGTIRVDSEVGKGSTFTIEIPWQPQVVRAGPAQRCGDHHEKIQ